MIRRIAHICLRTTDLDLTRRFWVEALGLEPGFEFVRDGRSFGFYLKAGDRTFIEVFAGEPGAVGNIDHVALEVDDLEGLIARIRNAGFEVGDRKLGADGSWQAWTADPSGVRIEFHEYTPESRQLTGGTCVIDW